MRARVPTSLGYGLMYSGLRRPVKHVAGIICCPCQAGVILWCPDAPSVPLLQQTKLLFHKKSPSEYMWAAPQHINHTDGVKDVWLCTTVSPGTHRVYGKRSSRVHDGVPLPPPRRAVTSSQALIMAVTALDGNAFG